MSEDTALLTALLEALKECSDILGGTRDVMLGNDPEGWAAVVKARAALAQAEANQQQKENAELARVDAPKVTREDNPTASENGAIRALLEEAVSHVSGQYLGDYCPVCGSPTCEFGHRASCWLGRAEKALDAAKAPPPPEAWHPKGEGR